MHRHDLNLIAALADGSLEDETQARARVKSCTVCRGEYESQLSLLAALSAADPASMTEPEKAALHRDVWTALRTQEPASTPTIPWWYRWSYAAAGLFLVVGLVAVIAQVGGDSDGVANTFEDGVAPAAEDAGDPSAADRATAADGGEDDSTADLQQAPAAPLDEEFEAGADAASETRSVDLFSRLKNLRETSLALSVTDPSEHEDCLGEAGLTEHRVIERYSLDEGDFVAALAKDAPDDADYTFVDLATCEVVPSGE